MIYDMTTLYFPQGSTTWMGVICNYFNHFSDRFHIENNYIIWDNKVKFTFTDARNPFVYLQCNDADNTVLELGRLGNWNRVSSNTYGRVTFILTDNLFYFTIVQTEGSAVWADCSGQISAIIDDDNKYYAGYLSENYSLNAISFVDVDTSASGYQIGKMFNFSTEPQKILCGSICPIFYSGGYFSNISTLVSCSNITRGIVITVSGKNYYTIGTNILVGIDN